MQVVINGTSCLAAIFDAQVNEIKIYNKHGDQSLDIT